MGKLCTACGEEPRMVSPKTGRELTMCPGCQRDYWANAKAAETRFCKGCRTNKPATQFAKSSRLCADCHQQRQSQAIAALDTLTPDAMRTCQACHERKPLTAFRRQGNYHQALCMPCYAARQADAQRREVEGLPPLKRLQFRGPELDIGHIAPATQPIHHPRAAGVLLVDRERGQVILCAVESEIPMDARRMDEIIAFYAARGHRIVDAVEQTAEVSHGRTG